MQASVITLWDWLAIEDKPEPCDLIFLFGGAILEIAEKSAELYAQDVSNRIVATGNTGTFGNPDWSQPIAEIFADYLVDHGVPTEALIVQNTSMNTLEDVTQALTLIHKQHAKHGSVAIVSRPVHQRRAYATYKMHDPEAHIINIPCNEPHPSTLKDHELSEVAKRCLQEYERLIKYAVQGDTCEQPIPPKIKAAYEELKSKIAHQY